MDSPNTTYEKGVSPPKGHPMAGKYEYITGDDELGIPFIFGPSSGLFKVVRPHASFYTLAMMYPETDPFPSLDDVTMDKGDVLLVTPAKTGTHFVYEIIRMLIAGKAEHISTTKNEEWIELKPYQEAIKSFTSGSRVLNSHLPLSSIPPNLRRPDTKVVVTMRNMKDTFVSYFNHFMMMKGRFSPVRDIQEEWKDYFQYCLYSKKIPFATYFDFYKEIWTKYRDDPNILVVRFEDVKLDTASQIRRIADHLELPYGDQLVDDMVSQVDIAKMREGKKKSESHLREHFGENKTIYRKGMIGDWKNWFTVAQNEEFDKVYNEWNKNLQIPTVWE